jgi:hypothetical protein
MNMTIGDALGYSAAAPTILGAFYLLVQRDLTATHGAYAIAGWLAFLSNVIDQSPGWSTWSGLVAAFCTYLWWKNRRNGRWKKAAKALGAKSKARVQALVRQITPSPIPSPVGGRT